MENPWANKEFRIDFIGLDISDYSEISPQAFRDTANFAEISEQLSLETEESKLEKYLTLWGTFARIGNQTYLDSSGGLRVEHRSEAEVIKSLNSFRNKSITVDHPNELILSANSRKYSRGISHEDVIYDKGLARIRITLTDEEAIKAIQTSHKELSAGYLARVVQRKGDWHGDAYTHAQEDIYGNHIALVPKGRAGKLAISHLGKPLIVDSANNLSIPLLVQLYRHDSSDLIVSDEENKILNHIDSTMTNQNNPAPASTNPAPTTINIDGVPIQLSESAAIAVNGKIKAYDSLIQSLKDELAGIKTSSQLAIDTANGQIKVQALEIENLKADAATKDKLIADAADPKTLQAVIRQRVELEKQAEKALGTTVALDAMSDQEIMRATLTKIYGDKLVVSDSELSGAFKVAIAQYKDARKPSDTGIVSTQNGIHKLADTSNVLDGDDELSEEAIAQKQFKMYADNASKPLSAYAGNYSVR